MNPIVIDPPEFDQEAAWKECGDFVDDHGGLEHSDGSPNWRAAFGADPGIVSCPACGEQYWCWGRVQRCRKCGFEYPTDWWPMYSYGCHAAGCTQRFHHEKRMEHAYYRFGFENPVDDAWAETQRPEWRERVKRLMAKERS